MTFLKWLKPLIIILFGVLWLAACNGSSNGVIQNDGDSPGDVPPSSDTVIVTSGSITSFGSIFVNGIEYDTQTANINVDDDSARVLKLGMVVRVEATLDDSGLKGSATSIEYDDDIEGPIDTVSIVENFDGSSKEFTVLGVHHVVVDSQNTVFDDISFDDIKQNADATTKLVVEVSGFVDANGKLQATRLEGKSTSSPGNDEVEIKGTVSELTGGTFTLNTSNSGNFTVVLDGQTDVSDLLGGLGNNLFVEVKGILNADGSTIDASGLEGRIKHKDDVFDDNVAKVSMEGIISGFNADEKTFKINGLDVNASSANLILVPTTLVLEGYCQLNVNYGISS